MCMLRNHAFTRNRLDIRLDDSFVLRMNRSVHFKLILREQKQMREHGGRCQKVFKFTKSTRIRNCKVAGLVSYAFAVAIVRLLRSSRLSQPQGCSVTNLNTI